MYMLLSALFAFILPLSGSIPADYNNLEKPVSYEELAQFLESIGERPEIEVQTAGTSAEGRKLFLVHFLNESEKPQTRIFLFAQQHGNEPAGKDALIYLIMSLADGDMKLPEGVDLWIMPMVNSDGAEKNQRRNAHDADLNRDHVLLDQPETRVLHQSFRNIMPHIAVDCHEFQRDSRDYREKGWLEWPQIMMDFGNNPLFDEEIRKLGLEWCRQAENPMNEAGINYSRYYLGGVPPEEELRYSTPEIDDARNGLGTYGGITFIIESGVRRSIDNPDIDLPVRVKAYLILFRQFLEQKDLLSRSREAVRASRNRELPAFIPVNYFWCSLGLDVRKVNVIDAPTGLVKKVETANFMDDLIVKEAVGKPDGYLIPAVHSAPFRALLERHAILFDTLAGEMRMRVESCRLLRMEEERDEVYNRYAGRQIVEKDTILEMSFNEGSLYLRTEGDQAMRIALLMEPLKLYGLFQYELFRKQVGQDGILPVYRVIGETTE